MARTIPSNENPIMKQSNRAGKLGDVVETFNIDWRTNLTGTRTNRSKAIYSTNDNANFGSGRYGLFGHYASSYYFVDDTAVWQGGNSGFDTPTLASSGEGLSDEGDTITFNNFVWISSENNLYKNTTAGSLATWTTITTGLTASSSHLMAVLGNRMYVTDNQDEVHTVNSSNVYSTTGTGTLDLGLAGYSITSIMAGSDRVWIAASPTDNNGQGQVSWVYEWDGETENNPTRKYKVETSMIMAGCIAGDTPYYIDNRGRLLQFLGVGFKEVDRIPLGDDEQLYGTGNAIAIQRSIHPRGMIYDGDEILINVNNRVTNSDGQPSFSNDFYAGIWAFNADNMLYHKFSHSYVPVGSTGTTITDYGQTRAERVGNIIVFRPSAKSTSDGGTYLWCASIFEDADNASSDGVTYIFTDDTFKNTQTWGYFITSEITSLQVTDTFQKIFLKNRKLISQSDKIVVKYKVDYDEATEASITWTATDTFTTTTNVSSYLVGDEVQVIQGTGGGKSAHIASISEASGTYTIVLDDTFTGASGTAIVEFSKWKKAGELADQYQDFKEFSLDESIGSKMQVKVCMQFTGKNQLDSIVVVDKDNKQAK